MTTENQETTDQRGDSSVESTDLFGMEAVRKLLIIAYSSGYEHGHHDTVEGQFWGDGKSQRHDSMASEWLAEAIPDGVFDRDLEL